MALSSLALRPLDRSISTINCHYVTVMMQFARMRVCKIEREKNNNTVHAQYNNSTLFHASYTWHSSLTDDGNVPARWPTDYHILVYRNTAPTTIEVLQQQKASILALGQLYRIARLTTACQASNWTSTSLNSRRSNPAEISSSPSTWNKATEHLQPWKRWAVLQVCVSWATKWPPFP